MELSDYGIEKINFDDTTFTGLQKIIIEDCHLDRHFFDNLSVGEKEYFLKIFHELKKNGSSKTLDKIWEVDFHRRPASIKTFLDDDYYFGSFSHSLYPEWRDDLEKIFSADRNYNEWILTGAIGTGKTTAGSFALSYVTQVLSCRRNPSLFYGHLAGEKIVIALFNINKYLSEDVIYAKLQNYTSMSPFFQEIRQKIGYNPATEKDDIILNNNIDFVMGASQNHVIGQDVFAGILSEANFQKDTPSKSLVETYNALSRRMFSRFQERGGNYAGILILDSSKKFATNFLDQHIKKVATHENVYLSDRALWEVGYQKKLDTGRYTGEKFWVVLGDKIRPNKIYKDKRPSPSDIQKDIKSTGTDLDGINFQNLGLVEKDFEVIPVPIEHLSSFEYDLDISLRDLAGISGITANRFITNGNSIAKCIRRNEKSHPFTKESFSISDRDNVMIDDYYLIDLVTRVVDSINERREPLLNPYRKRYIHVDQATKHCNLGISMGHNAGVKKITRVTRDGITTTIMAPIIMFDFSLRVHPPEEGEIDFSKVVNFIIFLDKIGYDIGGVSYDSWQSAGSLQTLNRFFRERVKVVDQKKRFTRVLSVEKVKGAYTLFKTALYEERIDHYNYSPYIEEVTDLITDGVYVNHEEGKFKDVADTAAGVVDWVESTADEERKTIDPDKLSDVILRQELNESPDTNNNWHIDDYKNF